MYFDDFPKTSQEMIDMLDRVGRRLGERHAGYFDQFVSSARKRGASLPPDEDVARLRTDILEDRIQLVDAVWQLVDPEERTDYESFRSDFQARQHAIAMQRLNSIC